MNIQTFFGLQQLYESIQLFINEAIKLQFHFYTIFLEPSAVKSRAFSTTNQNFPQPTTIYQLEARWIWVSRIIFV